MPRTKNILLLVGLVALRVMGALVALVALTLGAGVLVLQTAWGGEHLRRQVVTRVNQTIQGTLAIERLAFGGDKLVVWGVALADPAGSPVAKVARVEVDFSVIRVLHKELRLTAVVIETPRLTVVEGAQGSNLSRAIAPRKKAPPPAPAAPKTGAEGWVVRLDRFELMAGEVSAGVTTGADVEERVHVAGIHVFSAVRYATGNGSLDLTLRVEARSQLAPVGPVRLAAQVGVRGDAYQFDVDGELLGGTLKGRGKLDRARLERTDGAIALAIPRQPLRGYEWGPLRLDAQARPGTAPKLNVVFAVPGVDFVAKDRGQEAFAAEARLAVTELALTGRALQALLGGQMVSLGGRGALELGIGRAALGASSVMDARARGAFDGLKAGETSLGHLTIEGHVLPLSAQPESADLNVSLASLSAGTTQLRGLSLGVQARKRDLSAKLQVSQPAEVAVALAGSLDADRKGFALDSLSVSLPEERWSSQGTARLRFDEVTTSVEKLRLLSGDQALTVDGSKRGEDLAAHIALTRLRLGQLPTALLDPALRVEGELDTDVVASGRTDGPKVVARLDLRQLRYQGFSKIDAHARATLEHELVGATLDVDAPFVTANAQLEVPTDPLAPGAPLAVRLDVKHLDVGQALRGAGMAPLGDGRLNLKLRLTGSADKPDVDLGVEAFDLSVARPAAVTKGGKSIDLGHAHVQVTYAERVARAQLDFASSHGGTLVVDANAAVDLSYPRVANSRLVPAKLPVHGKVVARDLDVAWLARFNQRVESLGGQVSADARLAGTVGDPEIVGDVHWKNGQVVATAPPTPAAPTSPARKGARSAR